MATYALSRIIRHGGEIVGIQYWHENHCEDGGDWIDNDYPGSGMTLSRAKKRKRRHGGEIKPYREHPQSGGDSEW